MASHSVSSTFLSKPRTTAAAKPLQLPFLPSSTLPFSLKPNRTKVHLSKTKSAASSAATPSTTKPDADRLHKVHTIDEFNAALQSAKNKLVVVEFATSHSDQSAKFYPMMVQLSRTCGDVDFLLVMGDESEQTRELCRREGIAKIPHFSFYKNMEKIHEEEGIEPDQLMGDVLYYGDNHSSVVQLHSREDVEALMKEHEDGKLLVLDVGLKHCGPCVKVYPTVIKLSKSMADTVVFARMNGDENDSCMEFLKDMEVIQVPTFLFIRGGKICGRYVGSGKGELIGRYLDTKGLGLPIDGIILLMKIAVSHVWLLVIEIIGFVQKIRKSWNH